MKQPTMVETIARRLLARQGIGVIWQLHLRASASHLNGNWLSAAALIGIAEAAERQWAGWAGSPRPIRCTATDRAPLDLTAPERTPTRLRHASTFRAQPHHTCGPLRRRADRHIVLDIVAISAGDHLGDDAGCRHLAHHAARPAAALAQARTGGCSDDCRT